MIDTVLAYIDKPGIEAEYAEIVSLETFEKINLLNEKAIMLVAAKVSSGSATVRLIDNIEL